MNQLLLQDFDPPNSNNLSKARVQCQAHWRTEFHIEPHLVAHAFSVARLGASSHLLVILPRPHFEAESRLKKIQKEHVYMQIYAGTLYTLYWHPIATSHNVSKQVSFPTIFQQFPTSASAKICQAKVLHLFELLQGLLGLFDGLLGSCQAHHPDLKVPCLKVLGRCIVLVLPYSLRMFKIFQLYVYLKCSLIIWCEFDFAIYLIDSYSTYHIIMCVIKASSVKTPHMTLQVKL